jgi:hypothetical protein
MRPPRSAISENNPRAQFHFTPTYSSWLNQPELWFAKIERNVIAPRTSLPSLIWLASYAVTSMFIRPTPGPFSGNTQTPRAASLVSNSLRQATSPSIGSSVVPGYIRERLKPPLVLVPLRTAHGHHWRTCLNWRDFRLRFQWY